MGAAATIEIQKPADASDILATNDLNFARSEVIRLRKDLGHLAASYGMEVLSMDASDLVLGHDLDADFNRCVDYISHIRKCLQLNTQSSKRQTRRGYQRWDDTKVKKEENNSERSDESSDESEDDR
jgi:hypothetical protein